MRSPRTYPKGGKEESRVGIFWLVNAKLLIDSTPLDEAERYGDFVTHPRGHAEVWEEYQRNGTVFPETEYEELPHGRVMYNTKTRLFTLLADRCILKRMALVTQIKEEMHLPKDTKIGGDSHYRCSTCLSNSE